MIANSVVYQGATGHSLGKQLVGLKPGRPMKPHPEASDYVLTLAYPGITRCAFRLLIHGLICFSAIGVIIMDGLMLISYYHRSMGNRVAKIIVIVNRHMQLDPPQGMSTF